MCISLHTHSHLFGQNHVPGIFTHFICLTGHFLLLYHKKVVKYYLLHLQMGDNMTQPHEKNPVQTRNCWTELPSSILIRLKQALSLQNIEIWTFIIIKSHNKKMLKHCLINFAFIFCPWQCVFYVTMQEEGKVTQALLSLK